MQENNDTQRKLHPFIRRAAYSVAVILGVLIIGTLGFHFIEHYSYTYSFFFISMLATGEGPVTNPSTHMGLIFASVMAFVSIGTVVVALVYLFGPFFGRFLKFGEVELKKEERIIKKKI